jgi:hypothetical protein
MLSVKLKGENTIVWDFAPHFFHLKMVCLVFLHIHKALDYLCGSKAFFFNILNQLVTMTIEQLNGMKDRLLALRRYL